MNSTRQHRSKLDRPGRRPILRLLPMLPAIAFAAASLSPAGARQDTPEPAKTTMAAAQPAGKQAARKNLRPLRLGFGFSDDIYLSPVFAAGKLGLYEKAGLAVERVPLRGDTNREAFVAGQVDIIDINGAAMARAAREGIPGKIVASAATRFLGWTIIVRSANPRQSLGDLSGAEIGIARVRSLSEMAVALAAQTGDHRLTTKAVGAGSLIQLLRKGELAAVASGPLLGLREVSIGRARIVYDLGLAEKPYLVSGYVASNAMMNRREKDLRAFLQATFAGLAHMQKDRKWAIATLREYSGQADIAFAERLYDNVIRRMNLSGMTSAQTLKATAELGARAWNAPELAKVDTSGLFTNAFLPPAE